MLRAVIDGPNRFYVLFSPEIVLRQPIRRTIASGRPTGAQNIVMDTPDNLNIFIGQKARDELARLRRAHRVSSSSGSHTFTWWRGPENRQAVKRNDGHQPKRSRVSSAAVTVDRNRRPINPSEGCRFIGCTRHWAFIFSHLLCHNSKTKDLTEPRLDLREVMKSNARWRWRRFIYKLEGPYDGE